MFRVFKSSCMARPRWSAQNINMFCTSSTSAGETAGAAAASAAASSNPEPKIIIETTKKDIAQSPLKMRFLVMLVRDCWMPDALAQMKFSPKHRSEEIAQMLKRTCTLAGINHGAIPEELRVHEVYVTKGHARKKIRFMGRGRTGIGSIKKTHVTLKTEIINFQEEIAKAKTASQKDKWAKREKLVQHLKANPRMPPRVPVKDREKQAKRSARQQAAEAKRAQKAQA